MADRCWRKRYSGEAHRAGKFSGAFLRVRSQGQRGDDESAGLCWRRCQPAPHLCSVPRPGNRSHSDCARRRFSESLGLLFAAGAWAPIALTQSSTTNPVHCLPLTVHLLTVHPIRCSP